MMKTLFTRVMPFAVVALMTLDVRAAEHLVLQRDKAFAMTNLEVQVGDTVRFLNVDQMPHNAFSLSPSNPFDTTMLTKGASRAITFGNSGTVEVECAIH